MPDTKERILSIMSRHLDVDKDRLRDDASLVRDLGADSFDRVELTMAFEDHFNIELTDRDARRMHSVGDAITLVSAARRSVKIIRIAAVRIKNA